MLLWIDGFDHYHTSNNQDIQTYLQAVYSDVGEGNLFRTAGLNGGAVKGSSLFGSLGFRKIITPSTTVGIGAHFYWDDGPNRTGLFSFYDSGGTQRCTIQFTNGQITIRGGGLDGPVWATDPTTYAQDTWYHIEVKVVASTTVGTVEVRINGATRALATGRNTGADVASIFTHVTAGNGANILYDDLFIWNQAGSINNDWLGEQSVFTLLPNADTGQADWTLSTGSDGYEILNNVPATSDYIQAATVGAESIFGLSNLPSTDIVIQGVQTQISGTKDGSEATQIEFGVVTNSVEDVGTGVMTQNSYLMFSHITELNPDTTAAWQPSEINNLELIVRRSV